ncbi:MAG TPA: flagellar basal body rod protein FlgB [Verrucomicrobiae bacterium]
MFNQPGYLTAKRMMDATALRHEAIASNLANLETPGYKRIDLAPAFQSELQQAVKSREPQNLTGLRPSLSIDPNAVAANRDGNTVQMETELAHLAENTMAHQLETQLVSGSLLKLRLAITGRG